MALNCISVRNSVQRPALSGDDGVCLGSHLASASRFCGELLQWLGLSLEALLYSTISMKKNSAIQE